MSEPDSFSLADCTVDTFAALLGAEFTTTDAGGAQVTLQLEDASAQAGAPPPAPDGRARTPFSLTFLGPLSPAASQGTYRMRNEALGAFDLFIVPVSRDPDGARYEAVFA